MESEWLTGVAVVSSILGPHPCTPPHLYLAGSPAPVVVRTALSSYAIRNGWSSSEHLHTLVGHFVHVWCHGNPRRVERMDLWTCRVELWTWQMELWTCRMKLWPCRMELWTCQMEIWNRWIEIWICRLEIDFVGWRFELLDVDLKLSDGIKCFQCWQNPAQIKIK